MARGLTTEQLNWHPRPGAWSVGQCLDHLLVSNQQYLPAIIGALAGKARSPVPEIKIGWFGTWFIRSFAAESPGMKKVRAPGKIVPHQHVELSVLERFLGSNQSLRSLIREAGQYDVNHIRFKNPFIPLIFFTVGTGLEITVNHQHRHLLQAERVSQAQGFPG